MKKHLRRWCISCLFVIFFLLIPKINILAKQALDMSAVQWNADVFIYDNTVKCVELLNLPKEVKAIYEGNQGKEIRIYEAKVKLEFDQNLYSLVNYNQAIISNHRWEIKCGSISLPYINREYKVLEDGNAHSVELENLPKELLGVRYSSNNSQTEPGKYPIEVNFEVPQYYTSIQPIVVNMIILRKKLYSINNDVSIETENGFDPDIILNMHWDEDVSGYENMDLSSIGAYREVKAAFTLDMTLNQSHYILNEDVEIRITIPETITGDLAIYDYSHQKLVDLKSEHDFSAERFIHSIFNYWIS